MGLSDVLEKNKGEWRRADSPAGPKVAPLLVFPSQVLAFRGSVFLGALVDPRGVCRPGQPVSVLHASSPPVPSLEMQSHGVENLDSAFPGMWDRGQQDSRFGPQTVYYRKEARLESGSYSLCGQI